MLEGWISSYAGLFFDFSKDVLPRVQSLFVRAVFLIFKQPPPNFRCQQFLYLLGNISYSLLDTARHPESGSSSVRITLLLNLNAILAEIGSDQISGSDSDGLV